MNLTKTPARRSSRTRVTTRTTDCGEYRAQPAPARSRRQPCLPIERGHPDPGARSADSPPKRRFRRPRSVVRSHPEAMSRRSVPTGAGVPASGGGLSSRSERPRRLALAVGARPCGRRGRDQAGEVRLTRNPGGPPSWVAHLAAREGALRFESPPTMKPHTVPSAQAPPAPPRSSGAPARAPRTLFGARRDVPDEASLAMVRCDILPPAGRRVGVSGSPDQIHPSRREDTQ